MNKQEVFNKVAKHLLTQNSKSMAFGQCAYRGKDGRMCAVGCLIPDKVYTSKFENKNVRGLLDINDWEPAVVMQLAEAGIDQYNASLLMQLQRMHDRKPVEEWPALLAKIAAEYKLEMPA